MNKTILMGRPTKDPDIRYTQGQDSMCVARYTLAVDRTKKGEADFISCIAFGKQAEFAEKYVNKGTKIMVEGHIQTGSYTNKDGNKVYTTDVVVDRHEFCESKKQTSDAEQWVTVPEGFMEIPDSVNDGGLPWN